MRSIKRATLFQICSKRLTVRFFLVAFIRYQDDHNRAYFAVFAALRWLNIRLDMICVIFVTFVVYLAIITQSESGNLKMTYLFMIYIYLTIHPSIYLSIYPYTSEYGEIINLQRIKNHDKLIPVIFPTSACRTQI